VDLVQQGEQKQKELEALEKDAQDGII